MKSILLVLFCLLTITSFSQDTLMFMNGKDKLVEYKNTDSLKVYFTKKDKEKSAYLENVFAIGTKTGRIYIYKQDTAMEDDYTVEQMEQYQKGLRLGLSTYNVDVTAGASALIGLVSAYVVRSGFYGWLPVAVYTGASGATSPKEHKFKLTEEQKKNEFLVYGYTDGANRRKIKRTALAGTVGFIAGVIITSTIEE